MTAPAPEIEARPCCASRRKILRALGRVICVAGAQMAGHEHKHQPASTIRTGGGPTWP
jgi:hypothetical protein